MKKEPIILEGALDLLPPKGTAFIAWKVCRSLRSARRDRIVKLLIPASAARVRPKRIAPKWAPQMSAKCRASRAVVLEISDFVTGKALKVGYSWWAARHCRKPFRYAVGETAKPNRFDPSDQKACLNGIHFYTTRKAAEQSVRL